MADSRQLSPTSTLHDDRDQRQHASSALEKVDLAEKGSAVPYDGAGTAESPYIVKFLDGEQANPQNWTKTKKWQVLFFFASTCSCSAHRVASSSVILSNIDNYTQDHHRKLGNLDALHRFRLECRLRRYSGIDDGFWQGLDRLDPERLALRSRFRPRALAVSGERA